MKNRSHFPGNSIMQSTAIFMMMLFTLQGYAQGVAISESGAAPDPSAMLDVQSTEKGVLIPRMIKAERDAILLPQNGLLIYQTDESAGFYYNSGNATSPSWVRLGDDLTGVVGQWHKDEDDIYFNSGKVGIGTVNPEALLHIYGTGYGDGNVLFTGEKKSSPGVAPASGPGTRMMWYPDKAAFRVGIVTGSHWDMDSIGRNSIAMGYNTKALGYSSIAMGYSTTAISHSVALGMYSTASGFNSIALGTQTTASASVSAALGHGTIASSLAETAIGSFNTEYIPNSIYNDWHPYDRLFVIGNGQNSFNRSNALTVLKIGNIGIGTSTPAALLHTNGTGLGEGNVLFVGEQKSQPAAAPVLGPGTRMMWYPDKAAFRVGEVEGSYWDTDSIGRHSIAMGLNTKAFRCGIALGENASASQNGTAIGFHTTASNLYSTALGAQTTASGFGSTSAGIGTIAYSSVETVMGSYNTEYIPNYTDGWHPNDRLFVIGNGQDLWTKSNALTVLKNANVGIGISMPTQKLDVDGQLRIRGGNPGTGKVLTSDVNGVGTWQTPSWSNWTVSGSNIYRASGNVGIGASNPAFHLSIGDNGVGISRPATNTLSFHTASSERMRISSTGNVGIGSSAPGELLHVRNTSGTARIRVQSTTTSAIDFYSNTAYLAGIGVSVSEGHLFLYNGGNVSVKSGNLGIGNTNPGQKLDITAGNGRVQSGYAWLTNSDIRYKKNVSTLENVLAKVSNLRGVRYDLMADGEITPGHGKQIGFIAQELETEFPEFVITGEDGYKSVAYDKMTAVLLQAVKEQQSAIESHKEVIEQLMRRIENLEEEK